MSRAMEIVGNTEYGESQGDDAQEEPEQRPATAIRPNPPYSHANPKHDWE